MTRDGSIRYFYLSCEVSLSIHGRKHPDSPTDEPLAAHPTPILPPSLLTGERSRRRSWCGFDGEGKSAGAGAPLVGGWGSMLLFVGRRSSVGGVDVLREWRGGRGHIGLHSWDWDVYFAAFGAAWCRSAFPRLNANVPDCVKMVRFAGFGSHTLSSQTSRCASG
ncbi:hypothetical protein KC338_g39 [Hortaea werneckii]|nr:hypothetical protein KC338_g39 [Hortaea werneckii]